MEGKNDCPSICDFSCNEMNGGGRRRLGQSVVSVCTAVKRRPVAGSGAKANEQTQNVRVTKNLNNGGGKDA